MTNNDFSRVQALLESKKTFNICLPVNYSIDSLAAGLSFYLILSKNGKQASITCLSDINNNVGLIGTDKIKKNLYSHGNDLVISFPNKQGAVDQVNYGFEGNRFYVVIKPEPGAEKLDPQNVSFSYSGGKPDVIFTFDAPSLETLGDIYLLNKDKFSGIDIVNIDRHISNRNYGTINIIDKNISSLSELMLSFFNLTKMSLNKDIATNLYIGIASATNNFTAHNVDAATFEAVAFLIKNGANKKTIAQPQQTAFSAQPMSGQMQAQPIISQMQTQSDQVVSAPVSPAPINSSPINTMPQQGSSSNEVQTTPIEDVESKPDSTSKPPTDWLKPKIFKGTNNA